MNNPDEETENKSAKREFLTAWKIHAFLAVTNLGALIAGFFFVVGNVRTHAEKYIERQIDPQLKLQQGILMSYMDDDAGFDDLHDAAEAFILSVMHDWLEKIDPNISDKDAKTRLQEYLQKYNHEVPIYDLVSKQGKDHLQTFTIECKVVELNLSAVAEKRSRKKAEQHSAQLIIDKIKGFN